MNILSILVIIPLLTLLALFVSRNQRYVRTVAVAGFGLQLICAVMVAVQFLQLRAVSDEAMLLFSDTVWYAPFNIHYTVGVDGISVLMILLSAVVAFAGVFSSWNMERDFFAWYSLLSIGVFGYFISLDLFAMFMFYEIALIPMFLLIGVWGTGRKEYAATKLTLMLMGGSAFLLTGILGIYFTSGATTMNIMEIAQMNNIPMNHQYWIFCLTFIGFGVLGAMFPFHTWSPDGHASAPTSVSMLHAGVLMKLGGYGCFRVAIFLMPQAAHELSWIFLILTGIGVVYGAYGAVVQTDLKYMNAYSSVSHCGLVLFAILMLNQTAMTGAVLQMLSHGLMTALFFSLIGMIYGRTHTRDIREMGGMMRIMPFASVCYVIAGFASLGLPGFSGFVAEMTIFIGSFEHADLFRRVMTILATTTIVVTAVYILRTVGKVFYGEVQNPAHLQLDDAHWYERLSAVALIACIVAIGVWPSAVQGILYDSFAPVVEHLNIF